MNPPANDNIARPVEFDRQLAAAYPRLLGRARRFTTDPHALANQTAIVAMHRWANFRQTPGKPYFGFFTWLCWIMKGSAADYKRMRQSRIVTVSVDAVENPPERITNPNQESVVDTAAVLSALDARERDVLMRRVMGEKGGDIADDLGVTRQRVSQIEIDARAKVLLAAGMGQGVMPRRRAANDNVRVAA